MTTAVQTQTGMKLKPSMRMSAPPDDQDRVADPQHADNHVARVRGPILALRELQVHRRSFIDLQRRITNKMRAMVRQVLGWQGDLEKSTQSTIKEAAKRIVKSIETGEALSPDHPTVDASAEAFVRLLLEGRAPFDRSRKKIEKKMVALAESLPVYPWVDAILGAGALGLAIIVGEAGDLSNYSNPCKLRKRMGLAPYKGKAMSMWVKQGGLSKEEYVKMGYNCERRSAHWTIGDSLVKGNKGVYRKFFDDRLAYEIARNPEFVRPGVKSNGSPKVCMECLLRAQRYMEQKFLRDLWKAWRRASGRVEGAAQAQRH